MKPRKHAIEILVISLGLTATTWTHAEQPVEAQWQQAASPFDHVAGPTGTNEALANASAVSGSTLKNALSIPTLLSKSASSDFSEEPRKGLVERIGDIGFLQYRIDGFEQLPLRQKILVYHLVQAALAGQNIIYDQTHRHSLEIKKILEQVLTHNENINPALVQKIRDYFLRFWANHGNYDSETKRKFVPQFNYEDLREAVRLAHGNGGFKEIPLFELDAKLEKLRASIFDADFEPVLINTASKDDLLSGSAVNFYSGVTQQEAEAFDKDKPYPVVSRLVKENGAIREEVYRAGDPERGIPPGKYAEELGEIIRHLDAALPYVSGPQQKKALEHLIAFFKTGDPADFKEYNRAWVHDNSPVDAILGFIETYLDPLDKRGAFESIVTVRDPQFTKYIEAVAGQSDYFEKTAPWEEKYKKDKVVPITANAVNAVTVTGDVVTRITLGVNLPNDEEVREKEGSKNIIISNAENAYSEIEGTKITEEFAWDKNQIRINQKWGTETEKLMTTLHEVVGHASGKLSDALNGQQPSVFLKEYAGTLEEARAELFALWAIADPKLQKMGLIESPEVIEEAYRSYITKGGLTQLKKFPNAEKLTQAHARARNLIATYMLKKTGAVEIRKRDGQTYLYVADLKKMKAGVGELLGMLMKIKAEGDYSGAKELFDTYADPINKEWRDEVVRRFKKLDLPARYAPISPRLEAVHGPNGEITDVEVRYPQKIEDAALPLHD